ncbi:hypothetical protein SAMN04488081_0958 [Salimicrobium album]|uniref:30S ribosomal protein S12 n=1 Tax=Salimicrobium album TaxID=50717 RepID=A0A1H3DHA9_9BACI|nr:hypothetical protein SAMN04488081_0958 [Salimicrobium album]
MTTSSVILKIIKGGDPVGKQGQSRKKKTNKEYGRRGKYAKGKKKKK